MLDAEADDVNAVSLVPAARSKVRPPPLGKDGTSSVMLNMLVFGDGAGGI